MSREGRSAYMKQWRIANPKKSKSGRLRLDYGQEVAEIYQELSDQQKNVCAICKNPEQGRSLALDHNKQTKEVRGLLCTKCNLGLGLFKDNILRLESAITYLLENYSGRRKVIASGRRA
jgi:hypothetical protein